MTRKSAPSEAGPRAWRPGSGLLALCGSLLISSALAAGHPDTEASAQANSAAEDAAVRDFFSRVAQACGLVGKETVRVLVVPVQAISAPKDSQGSEPVEFEPEAEDAGAGKPPKSIWIPNTMVEGRLTSAADLDYEMARLRAANPSAARRPGAPSPVLLEVLAASQREAQRRPERSAPQANQPQGDHLGRGVPWKAAETNSETPQNPPSGKRYPLRLWEPNGQSKGAVAAVAKKPGGKDVSTPAIKSPHPASPDPGYVAVVFRGAFHAFDEVPGQSLLVELEGDEVGRIKDQGKEWAWLQLDSGLMGVMKNKYLRQATPGEIREFLAMEGPPKGASSETALSFEVIDLDSSGLPIQSQVGTTEKAHRLGESAAERPIPKGEVKLQEPSR
jgi:hypothetical protein